MTNQKGDNKGKVTNLFSEQGAVAGEISGNGENGVKGIPLPKPPTSRGAKLRRSTFQLRNSTVDDVDRFHLELQLALGKQNAPYKEVLVEAAIVYFLDSARANPSEWLDVLLEWQQMRRSR
ncbi:MAG: hypothetical protein ACFCBU_01145 [Cyanophyceae cyanobacterium]